MLEWRAFMKKYYPDGDLASSFNTFGYSAAWTLAYILQQCGDNLTRENVMRQAANMKNLKGPLSITGISIDTSPTDFAPIKSMQPIRFDGKTWQNFGDVLSGM
jgi:hypothetical protein